MVFAPSGKQGPAIRVTGTLLKNNKTICSYEEGEKVAFAPSGKQGPAIRVKLAIVEDCGYFSIH